ncbi:MAG: PQQ-dependent sugar dehydrogenase, partial [Candidatus Zixiibacteriota bacterium]
MKTHLKFIILCSAVILAVLLANRAEPATPLAIDTVASGLIDPVFVTFAPGDSSRVFIIEQPGRIRIVKNGSLLTRSFLDIDSIVNSSGNEQGLLGMAFHPNYQSNGRFYVNYSNSGGHTVVARYNITANPDSANANSRFNIITINQPFSNHNGGMLAFGPNDGYLYIGMGDGGSADDPGNRAQNKLNLLGKMLRIDVESGIAPYIIPSSNPFTQTTGFRREI